MTNSKQTTCQLGAAVILASICVILQWSINAASVENLVQYKNANCSNAMEMLDKCGANSSYSYTDVLGVSYPTTMDEHKSSCPRLRDGLTCLRRHIKCLPPLPSRAMLAFVDGRRQHLKTVCGVPESKESRNFVAAFNCLHKKKQKQIEIEQYTIRHMEAIIGPQVTDFKERFQRACCLIFTYRNRVLTSVEPECSNTDYIVAIENIIESVVGGAVQHACPDPSSGVCKSYKPLKVEAGPTNTSLAKVARNLLMAITQDDIPMDKEDKRAKDIH